MVNEATDSGEAREGTLIYAPFIVLENNIPDLSTRMTVRTLRTLCENGRTEMLRAVREGVSVFAQVISVYCTMRKTVQALAAANAGSAAGRLCGSITKSMCVTSDERMLQCLSEGDNGGVVQCLVTVYEATCTELVALIEDDEFIASMGPNSRRDLMGLHAVFQYLTEKGRREVEKLRR